MTQTFSPTATSERIKGIRTSRGIYPRLTNFAAVKASKPICYGDRIHVRVRYSDYTDSSYVTDSVASMTELLGDLRQRFRRRCGLVKVTIRNMSRGWSAERPLSLYGESYPRPEGWRVMTSGAEYRMRIS